MNASGSREHQALQQRPYAVIIDDDHGCLSSLEMLLRSMGVYVSAYSGMHVTDILDVLDQKPCIVFIDYQMAQGICGEECALAITSRSPDTKCVVLTGDTSRDVLKKMETLGCTVLHKPASPALIKQEVFSKIAFCPARDPVTKECLCLKVTQKT